MPRMNRKCELCMQLVVKKPASMDRTTLPARGWSSGDVDPKFMVFRRDCAILIVKLSRMGKTCSTANTG